MRKRKKRGLGLLLLAGLFVLTATVGIAAVAWKNDGFVLGTASAALPRQQTALGTSSAAQTEPDAQPAAQKRYPDELRAVTITPGVDFDPGADEQTQKKQIDAAIDSAKELKMNALVVETRCVTGEVIYASQLLPATAENAFDALGYAIEAARAADLYSYAVYHLTGVSLSISGGDEVPAVLGKADAALIDAVAADVSGFAGRYAPDGVLLDGYYNVASQKSYARYLSAGGGSGYEDYMTSVPQALLRLARMAFDQKAPSVAVGLRTEAVWANDYENEQGSITKARFSTLADGNADTLRYLQEGLADFVAVQAYGSLSDDSIPYQDVITWWDNQCESLDVPFYVEHAADRAVTDAVGWSEYDELSRQIIEARELDTYGGSIFNSLSRLLENPKDFATKLVGYYDGTVKAEHIMQDLELTRPERTDFTSFDPTVMFAGHTDPNSDATINGQPLTIDENGYFELEMQLEEGDNTFTIVHKGQTVTYQIKRVTEVVKEVSPGSGVLAVDGATKLTIEAVAYDEATVYAKIGGSTVTLTRSEDEDHDLRDTAYARFTGVFTVPDAKTTLQNLGPITVYGSWEGVSRSKTGATIHINARRLPSDGTPVVVVADYAETFPGNTISQYSDPTLFPLAKGTLDYAISDELRYTFNNNGKATVYSFYRLQSGLRVSSDAIEPVGVSEAPVNNVIDGCSVVSDARYTKVIINTRQKVAYTATYGADSITVQFHYTNGVPRSMALTANPLFSNLSFKGSTMTLKLRENGKFMGMKPSYDKEGNLVLSFNNPPAVAGNSLRGAKIVIDPGHGVNDSGALGYLSAYPEKVINYAIGSKLATTLKNRGATVVLINSQSTNYSIEQRRSIAQQSDPHLFVSVHANSSAYNRSATGSEAYFFNAWSSPFAQYAAKNVSAALGTGNRGHMFGNYLVTRSMQYPAILVETGFVSNQTEYHKLIDGNYQSNIATAIANSIAQYFAYMSSEEQLTGTETTGSMTKVPYEPAKTAPAAGTGNTDAFKLNKTALALSVGESALLEAQWAGDVEYTVNWSAEGSANAVQLKASGETMEVEGIGKGEVTITARAQQDKNLYASCTITVK